MKNVRGSSDLKEVEEWLKQGEEIDLLHIKLVCDYEVETSEKKLYTLQYGEFSSGALDRDGRIVPEEVFQVAVEWLEFEGLDAQITGEDLVEPVILKYEELVKHRFNSHTLGRSKSGINLYKCLSGKKILDLAVKLERYPGLVHGLALTAKAFSWKVNRSGWKALSVLLSRSNLPQLVLSGIVLRDPVDEMLITLSSTPTLVELHIIRAQVDCEALRYLGMSLASPNSMIHTLRLERVNGVNLDVRALTLFFKHVNQSTQLKSLIMKNVNLIHCNVLVTPDLTSLKSLEIWEVNLDDGLDYISLVLQSSFHHLQKLSLGLMSIEGLRLLSNALLNDSCLINQLKLKMVALWWGEIGEHLITSIAKSKVSTLHLIVTGEETRGDNHESFYATLGRGLDVKSCKLERLELDAPGVSRQDLDKFLEYVKASTTLQRLELKGPFTLKEQASLGDAIRGHSTLRGFSSDSVPFASLDFLQSVVESRLKCLQICVDEQNMDMLCTMVFGNPSCSLNNLVLMADIPAWMSEGLELNFTGQLERFLHPILQALETNFFSELEQVSCVGLESQKWNKEVAQILKRNALFRTAFQLDNQTQIYKALKVMHIHNFNQKEPDAANLFLCGSSGAGKTTIKGNLTRKFSLPSYLQNPASTSGIEIQPLSFKSSTKKLVIWDLAGQLEFHAFHRTFLGGVGKSIFLLVLKITSDLDMSYFEMEMVYWLRFIASHKSTSNMHKPKVLIALNFFYALSETSQTSCMESFVRDKVEEYKDVLEVDRILTVQAIRRRSLKELRDTLKLSVEALISGKMRVPLLIEAAKTVCKDLRSKSIQVVSVKEVGEKFLAQHYQENNVGEVSKRLSQQDEVDIIRFTFKHLHDIGEVVYFESRESISHHAILDTKWFVHDVISLFIDPSKINVMVNHHPGVPQQHYIQNLHAISDQLKQHCGREDNVDFIFECLYEMGIILPMTKDWNGKWTPLPAKVIVPVLIKDAAPVPVSLTNFKVMEFKYLGRRLECRDVKFKLFPPGIFAMIQSKLHQECKNPSFEAGDGWVVFRENTVHVLVRVGGDTDSWMDRQWVDIMLMLPKDSSSSNHDHNSVAFEAEKLMNKMKACILDICLGEMEIGDEKVLNSRYVEGRMHGRFFRQDWQLLNSHKLAVTLSEIKKELRENGLSYSHTWCGSEDDKLVNLLLPSESRKYLEERNESLVSLCREYNEFVKEVYGTPPLDTPLPDVPTGFRDEDSEKLAGYMKELTIWQQTRSEKLLVDIAEKLEHLGKQVHANTSRLLHSLKLNCPKYPYVVSTDNKFIPYMNLVSTTVKVHYMCESEHGSHPVRDVGGVDVELPKEWLNRWCWVLVPSLVILFTAAKVAASLSGAMFLNEVLEESKNGMVEFLKRNTGSASVDLENLKKNRPTQDDIEELFKLVVKQQTPGGATDDTQMQSVMRRKFGLEWSPTAAAWLCAEHK